MRIVFPLFFQSGWRSLTVHWQVNISLVVHDSEAKQCVQALHSAFFENGFLSEVEEADLAQNNGSPVRVNSNGAMHGN
jgi:aspartate kinase